MAKLKGGTRIYGDIKIDGGIYDSSNQVGVGGSVLISTGVGIAWTAAAGSGAQGSQGVQGSVGAQGNQGVQGASGGGGSGSLSVNDDIISTTPIYVALSTTTSGPIGFLTVSSSKLAFIPSSGSLGIGTSNPTSNLTVFGNTSVTGISTSRYLDGAPITTLSGSMLAYSYYMTMP